MLTFEEIRDVEDVGTGTVHVVDNPATPENDPVLALIAKRMEQFKNSKWLNPNRVSIEDFDVASAFTEDPLNPVDNDHPGWFYVFKHKKTKKAGKFQNSAKYGHAVPFNIVKDLSDLADR